MEQWAMGQWDNEIMEKWENWATRQRNTGIKGQRKKIQLDKRTKGQRHKGT